MAEDTTGNKDDTTGLAPVYDDDGIEITDLTNFEREQMAAYAAAAGDDDQGAGDEDAKDDADATASAAASAADSDDKGGEASETYKVKINGEVKEVSLDDLTSNYSLGQTAQSKMQEASHLHKQATEFIKALKADPLNILMDERLGLDFEKVIESFVKQKSEYNEMNEDQQQLAVARQKLAQFENQRKQQEATDQELFLAQQSEQITKQIDVAIDTAGLPNNTFVFNRYIEYMQEAIEKGVEVTPAALSQLVEEDYSTAMKDMLGKAAPDELINLLGDKVKDIRKYEVDKLKNDNRVTGDDKPTAKTKKDDGGLRSLEDFKESLGIFG